MPTNKDKQNEDTTEKEPILQQEGRYSAPRLPMRYIIVFMSCAAMTLNFSLRMNWSVAILSMVRQQNKSQLFESSSSTTEHQHEKGLEVFDWDLETQQHILGVFYFGYTATSILGGWLVGKYGGFPMMTVGAALSSLMALATPFCARTSIGLLTVTRIIDGAGQSIVPPAGFGIIAKWAPINERSTLVSIMTSGMSVGAILGSLLSTWLCTSTHLGGWPSTFYTFGACGIVWCFVWCIVGSNEAANNRWITPFERDLILESQQSAETCREKDYTVPWKKIILSAPFWSLCFALFCFEYGYYLLYADIPTFLETILGFNITTSGLVSVAPHVAYCITSILGGIAADKVISGDIVSVTVIRKLLTCFVLGISSILLVLIGYSAANVTLAVILQMLVFAMYGLAGPALSSNAIDITPNHSALIIGIAFTIAGISGYIGPAVVGAVTRTHNTIREWKTVFWITAGIQSSGLLTFLTFGSGDVQF